MIKQLATAAVLAATWAGGSAQAANIPLFGGFLNQLSDNSAEYLINGATSTGSTTLEVGDRLRGIFSLDSIENLTLGGSPVLTPYNGTHELTGIFDITVLTFTDSGVPGAARYSWTFGATAQVNPGASGLGVLAGTGAAVAMYEDSSPDFARAGCSPGNTIADCEALATDGSLWATLVFGATSFWSATAFTNDIDSVGSVTPPSAGGAFNLGLNVGTNNTGYLFDPHACLNPNAGGNVNVQWCGSGSLLGTAGANTPYQSYDNVDFTVKPVPEPASVALLGLGLAGLGIARRRKQ